MERSISKYHAIFFEEIAAAVELCDRLVPCVSPRAGGAPHDAGRASVWLHVPPRSTQSTRSGCYLLLSPGAMTAAVRAGIVASGDASGELSRRALPARAVLVLGDDVVETRAPAPAIVERAERAATATLFTPVSGARSEAAAR